jgi:hypothetical protein
MPANVRGSIDMEKQEPSNRLPYWTAMVGGAVRMLFPTRFAGMMVRIGQNIGMIGAAALIIVLLGSALIASYL